MDKMKPTALVHDFLFAFGGAERVLQSLHQLFPEAPIYTSFAYPELVKKHFPQATIITSGLQKSIFRHYPALLINQLPQAVESFDLSKYSLVISSSGAFSHGVITGPATTHICFCHSPMRYGWDYHSEYLQEKGITGSLGLALANTAMHRLRIWDAVSSQRVDHWIAISQVVADRIQKYYQQESSIIHPPVQTDYFNYQLIPENKPGDYAISVSRLTANKHIDLIIQACDQVGLPLRIAGTGKDLSRLRQIAEKSKIPVNFLGSISEQEKRQQIGQARCFLFAAEDDFGIAPVEALAMGIPVIAYAKGGAKEYIKPTKNGYFFEPQTSEALASQLSQFLENGVQLNQAGIRGTALKFGETHFKQSILDLVQQYA